MPFGSTTQYDSLVTFVRRALKYQSTNQHTGRGFYVCDIPAHIPWVRIKSELLRRVPLWKKRGTVVEVEELIDSNFGEVLTIVFNKDRFGPYRELTVHEVMVNKLHQYCIGYKAMVQPS